MNFELSLIAVLACFAATTTVSVQANTNVLYRPDSNMGFLSFMSRSNDLLQRNPTRSLECFNYYIPLINEIAVQYENNYKACLEASVTGRTSAEEATLEQRNNLAIKAEDSCERLSKCTESESVEEEFECYIKGGSENSKIAYGINVDASDELAELLEQFRLIETQENRCTNETKRSYEAASGQAYEDLNNCILGIAEVPTEAPPSTEEPSTEEPSTEEPSTEEPSTEEPSTEEPSTEEPSTEEPSTEEPSTEEPSTEEPSTEEPSTEEPSTEEPSTEEPSTEEPSTEEPSTEEPSTEEPSTEEPSTEEPSTEEPSTEEPSTEEPSTEEPSTEEPSTEEPSTEEPSTEEPSTEESATDDPASGNILPEEDIRVLRAVKNLRYRLQQQYKH